MNFMSILVGSALYKTLLDDDRYRHTCDCCLFCGHVDAELESGVRHLLVTVCSCFIAQSYIMQEYSLGLLVVACYCIQRVRSFFTLSIL